MPQPKNSLRTEHRRAARTRILEAAVAVLESDEPCTMRSVARSAGVSERTIYRHFDSRDRLTVAVREHLQTRTSLPLPEGGHGLADYASDLFALYEANRRLLSALGTGLHLGTAPARSRRRDLVRMRALVGCNFPTAPLEDRRSAAASLYALLNAAAWIHLRVSCSLANDEIIRSAQWAIQRILERLETPVDQARSTT